MGNINIRKVDDLREFVREIYLSAGQPPNRRGNARHVIVRVNVEPLGRVNGSDQFFFRARSDFDDTIKGNDNEFRDRVAYEEVASVESDDQPYTVNDHMNNFLNYLKEEVGKHNPALPSQINDNCLLVESAAYAFGFLKPECD